MKDKGRKVYKKVRHEGGSRVLAVGSFLPPDWEIVRIKELKSAEKETILLQIKKVA